MSDVTKPKENKGFAAEWIGKFKSLFASTKEQSLDERSMKVRHEFYERFPMPEFYDAYTVTPYVVAVYDSYVIVCQGDDYYKATYTTTDEGVEFANPAVWTEVESAWVEVSAKESKQDLSIFKQEDGKYRWVAFTSSAYKDRDGEIVTLKAQEEDIARMDAAGDYGVLRWWHVGDYGPTADNGDWVSYKAKSGADLGVCDFSAMHGKIRVESGTFYDNEVAEAFKEHLGSLELSNGFSHPADQPDSNKSINDMHTFERSLLPAGIASNLFTAIPVIEKEKTMNDKKESKLKSLIGEDRAAKVLGQAATTEKSADAAGVAFKEGEQTATEQIPLAEASAPRKIGDMTEAEFTGFLGKSIGDALAGVSQKEAQTQAQLDEVKVGLKAAQDGNAYVLTALKAVTDIQTAQGKMLAKLDSDLPPIISRGFRASQDESTITTKEAPQAAGPKADDFFAFALGQNSVPTAG
jgi:hypothetical protein